MDHIVCFIVKTSQLMFSIFSTLQCCFILNTSVDSKFIKFIKQSGAT